MKLIRKIWEYGKKAYKEHPASIITCIVFCVLMFLWEEVIWSIKDSNEAFENAFQCITEFVYFLIYGMLFTEAVYYLQKTRLGDFSLKDMKKAYPVWIVCIVSVIISLFCAFKDEESFITVFDWNQQGTLIDEFVHIYIVVVIFGTIFFLYKKSKDTFERYMARACWSCVRAGLLYMIVAIGLFFIQTIFEYLITDEIDLVILQYLAFGFIGYPAFLLALSKPKDKLDKFESSITVFVTPILLFAGMVIAYVYIIKILITWTFPSNEAFTVMTSIFGTGVFVWTMGQGISEGKIKKALDIMPLLFTPFIVMQIMCLYMRISEYGITASRYYGIMVIVFEIIYIAASFFFHFRKKNCGFVLIPMTLIMLITAFHVPFINVFSSVYRSQVKVVEKYLNEEDHGGVDIKTAQSSFRALEHSAGRMGKEYVEDLRDNGDQELYEALSVYHDCQYTNDGEALDRIVLGSVTLDDIDVSGYNRVCLVNSRFEVDEDFDITNLRFYKGYNSYSRDESEYWDFDLEEYVNGFTTIYDNDSEEEQDAYFDVPIDFEDGSRLYITYLRYGLTKDGKIIMVDIEGTYLLK